MTRGGMSAGCEVEQNADESLERVRSVNLPHMESAVLQANGGRRPLLFLILRDRPPAVAFHRYRKSRAGTRRFPSVLDRSSSFSTITCSTVSLVSIRP